MNGQTPPFELRTAVLAVGVTAVLYWGRDLLIPLALAVLLSLLLRPAVAQLERLGTGTALAVSLVALLVGGALALALGLLAGEIAELFAGLPGLRENLLAKARALRGPLRLLGEALGDMQRLGAAVAPGDPGVAARVEVVERPDWLAMLRRLVFPVLSPAGLAAVVAVLTVFLLFDRVQLRERLIRLIARDGARTTQALDEAADGVTRYLLRQGLLCAVHGTCVGVGLYLLDLPGAPLFAALSAGLRLIPYVGPWMAAALPVALAAAAFPGWSMALSTAGFFVALELVSNNLLEPWLYGSGVGITPFGVVFAAFFWAWLWGGMGLLLAIPMTVCGVVLGRYVPQLSFVTTLFGQERRERWPRRRSPAPAGRGAAPHWEASGEAE